MCYAGIVFQNVIRFLTKSPFFVKGGFFLFFFRT